MGTPESRDPDGLTTAAGLAAFLELSPDAVVIVDPGGLIRHVNTEAVALFGHAAEDLSGRPVEMLVPAAQRTVHEVQRVGFSAVPSRRPMGAGRDLYAQRADGTLVPVDISLAPIEADGEALVAAVVRDVSDRHEVESRQREVTRLLRGWQQRFHTSVEAMADPVLFLQVIRQGGEVVDFVIDYANQAAADVLGRGQGALAGERLLSRFPGFLSNGLFDAFVRVIATGRPGTQDLPGHRESGVMGSFTVRAARLEDGLVVVLHDVTDRQRAEDKVRDAYAALEEANAQLQRINLQLEAANRHQEQFVSMASHELRTPLTTIAGFAETLAERWDDLDDATRRQYLDVIQRGVSRQTVLLSDLLDVARIRAGRMEIEPERVELRQVVDEAIEASKVGEGDVRVRLVDAPAVMADLVRLVQILVNLLTNAAKYGRPPIDLWAERVDDVVEIRVRDHGDGVPEEFEPALFTMFSQASAGDRRTATGTGLGLFIVRALTAAQGGTVEHRRPPGGGAEFVLRLPAA